MKRRCSTICAALLSLALVAAGCGDDGGSDDDGTDGNDTGTVMDTGMDDNGGDDTGTDDTEMADMGSEDTAGGGCDLTRPVTVNGTAQIHPVTSAIDGDANLENTEITLYNAIGVIGGNPSALTYKSDGECQDAKMAFTATETSKSFTFNSLETDGLSTGLVSFVDDSSDGDDSFVQTASGLAQASDFEGGPESFDLPSAANAVTSKTIEDLASAAGSTKSDWLEKGIMLGRFVDADGNPVADVKVGTVSDGEISETIGTAVYPNSDYSDATVGSNGGSTSDNGVFIVPDRSLTSFGGTETSTGDSSLDTGSQQGATVSDTVFTIELEVGASGGG